MFKHSLKSRVARLALGALIAGTSTSALIGAGTSPAQAATKPPPTITTASNAPEFLQVKPWAAINVKGTAQPGETVFVSVRDVTTGSDYGLSSAVASTSSWNKGSYVATTAASIPASTCGHTLSAQAFSTQTGQVSVTKSFALNCDPQLQYIKNSAGEIRFYGTRFTPGGGVTITRSYYYGTSTEGVTARSTGLTDSKPFIGNCDKFRAKDQTTGKTTAWIQGPCIL